MSHQLSNDRLCILGCGVMGQSILRAMLSTGTFKCSQIWCTTQMPNGPDDISAIARDDLQLSDWQELKVSMDSDNAKALEWSSVVLLSYEINFIAALLTVIIRVKPYSVKPLISQFRALFESRLVLSIAAGVSLVDLDLPRVARLMPNTPCKISQGMTTFCIDPTLPQEDLVTIETILSAMGRFVRIDEHLIAPATAIAGCGPAFVSLMMESVVDGGVLLGLPRNVAQELAMQTFLGTTMMMLDTKPTKHLAQFRNEVCTPGGYTIKGLHVLEHFRIRYAIASALRASANGHLPDDS